MRKDYDSMQKPIDQQVEEELPKKKKKQKKSAEDWGESFDDMDGVDWANHLNGPSDDRS